MRGRAGYWYGDLMADSPLEPSDDEEAALRAAELADWKKEQRRGAADRRDASDG